MYVFDVPFRGSIVALLIVSTAFLSAMLPLGLLISTLTKNQFAASQAALIAAFLPAFELSGFIFEIDAMPWPIRWFTYLLPPRYFVASLQTLFLAGDVMSVLVPDTLALLADERGVVGVAGAHDPDAIGITPMWQRIRTLIVKEFLAVWRDPKSRAILIVPPLVEMLVFSFAATQEVKNVRIAVLNRDVGTSARDLVAMFEGSPNFSSIQFLDDESQIAEAIDSRTALMVLQFRPTFLASWRRAGRPRCNCCSMAGARTPRRSSKATPPRSSTRFNADLLAARRGACPPATVVASRLWFNPNQTVTWNTVPSLVAILTTLMGLLVTALSVARERELGTFEQLLVSPLGPLEIIIGKTVPALLLGMAQATAMILAGVFIFRVPFEGSLLLLYGSMVVYLFAVIGVGLFVSSLAKTQQQAILGAFVFMVPAMSLSGFASPIENMPDWLQYVTLANPIRYYIVIVKGIFLKECPGRGRLRERVADGHDRHGHVIERRLAIPSSHGMMARSVYNAQGAIGGAIGRRRSVQHRSIAMSSQHREVPQTPAAATSGAEPSIATVRPVLVDHPATATTPAAPHGKSRRPLYIALAIIAVLLGGYLCAAVGPGVQHRFDRRRLRERSRHDRAARVPGQVTRGPGRRQQPRAQRGRPGTARQGAVPDSSRPEESRGSKPRRPIWLPRRIACAASWPRHAAIASASSTRWKTCGTNWRCSSRTSRSSTPKRPTRAGRARLCARRDLGRQGRDQPAAIRPVQGGARRGQESRAKRRAGHPADPRQPGLADQRENPLDVPADLDQNFSTVRQALADLLVSIAPLGVMPTTYDCSPKQIIEEFYKRDPEGNLDRIYARLMEKRRRSSRPKAKVHQAEADLDQAELNLRYCDVFAEIDGVITRRNVNPGNNVQAGQALMAIRSLTEIWIDANFKETQLAELRIGQPVEVEVDMYGGRQHFRGRITGFTMGTGSTLALLPPQNATGNFIKVVQRLPVASSWTITIPEEQTLFIGLSVVPYVYFKKRPTGPNAGKRLQEVFARSRRKSHSNRKAGMSTLVATFSIAAVPPRRSTPGWSRRPWSCRRSWRCSTRRSPTWRCAYIAGGLSAAVIDSEWVITSYLAANAIILPISGWLSAHLGRRNYFLLSIAVFTIASGLCGMATSLEQMILFRVLQGLAGGGLQPSSQGVLLDTFPPEKQGAAMTLFGMAGLVAPVVGPTLGGYITDNYTWRWIFYINMPMGAIAFLASYFLLEDPDYLKQERAELTRRPLNFDIIGLVLLVVVMVSWEIGSAKGSNGTGWAIPSAACRRFGALRVGACRPDLSRAAHRKSRGQFSPAGRAQFCRFLRHHFLRLRRAVRRQHVAARFVAIVVRLRRQQFRPGHVSLRDRLGSGATHRRHAAGARRRCALVDRGGPASS